MDEQGKHGRWLEDVAAFSRRVLSTILFADLVESTDGVLALGDRAWSQLVERHHAGFRKELARFEGTEVDNAGDGFFATFANASLAVACALMVRDRARQLGLELRIGLHTGECECQDGRVRGVAVHVGARVMGLASPGEVLVTGTVRDVVAGSGMQFDDRGFHELRGFPGVRRLFAARDVGTAACSVRPSRRRRRAAGVSRAAGGRVSVVE